MNERQSQSTARMVLALLPIISFIGQYLFSIRAGTEQILLHHPVIMFVDWVFIPFNFFVVGIVDWHRGLRLFFITGISIVLNVLTSAFWQVNGIDPGHMIDKAGFVLPAGWIHLVFATLEMILLVAFVFCRKASAPRIAVASLLATAYFLSMGVSGYAIHHRFIISDVIVVVSGLFFVNVYPRLIDLKSVS